MRSVVALTFIAFVSVAPVCRAEVTRIEVKQRADVGGSGYEKIFCAVYAVDGTSMLREPTISRFVRR